MKTFGKMAVAIALALVILAAPAFASANDPVVDAVDNFLSNLPADWFQMQPDVVAQKLDLGEDLFVLDVRRPDEYAAGHLEGAINAPVHDLAKLLDRLPADKDTPMVVYCRSGVRSMFATSALLTLGYTHVWNMPGGFLKWVELGFDVEK